ncbi:hypothetical protein HII31_13198 [Pseudocercospora fuligena]|uniref:Uncharacterized protein n=1 Tax=Pseudocercospora fuligena TaxID=685502 RepID=A0A8H6R6T5_9PEZI|nr:hypothetical protein HII31_13198 [Pseudocercospora fuligena]
MCGDVLGKLSVFDYTSDMHSIADLKLLQPSCFLSDDRNALSLPNEIQQLQDRISDLDEQVSEKNSELTTLQQSLAKLSKSDDLLKQKLSTQRQRLDDQRSYPPPPTPMLRPLQI